MTDGEAILIVRKISFYKSWHGNSYFSYFFMDFYLINIISRSRKPQPASVERHITKEPNKLWLESQNFNPSILSKPPNKAQLQQLCIHPKIGDFQKAVWLVGSIVHSKRQQPLSTSCISHLQPFYHCISKLFQMQSFLS